jgi:hypothetical protein
MKDNTMKWAMCGVLSRDINGAFKTQYVDPTKAPSDGGGFVTEEEWPRFRTALCDLSMKILDFRVEEKIQVHYSKFVGKNIEQTMLKDIIEEWRKSEWIDLVRDSKQKGGNPSRPEPGRSRRRTLGKRVVRGLVKLRNSMSPEEKKEMRKTNASEKRKGSRDSKLLELRSRGPGYPFLKELNDNALLLPIYFDVFDAVTEDEEERICRAETMAENYRENFYDYVDTDALNHEMMAALENIGQGMDIETGDPVVMNFHGRSKRTNNKKKKKPSKAKKTSKAIKKKGRKPSKAIKRKKGRKSTRRKTRMKKNFFLNLL